MYRRIKIIIQDIFFDKKLKYTRAKKSKGMMFINRGDKDFEKICSIIEKSLKDKDFDKTENKVNWKSKEEVKKYHKEYIINR